MRVQRVREAENRVETQIVKWTAEGTVKSRMAEYSVTRGHALVAGDMLVSRKERGFMP